MKHAIIGRSAGIAAALCLSMSLVRAANAPGSNLYIGGGLASSRVIQQGGIAYVPVADVARALNQVVVAKADGYAITPAGGANQVSGLNGKIGDRLTDGQLMISVVKAFRTDKYQTVFGDSRGVTPDGGNDDVVVAVLRVKNMLKEKTVEIYPPHGDSTALTDQDEHTYKSVYTDSHDTVPKMLPASACDFALCFSIPKSEKVGDLIFQVFTYGATKPSIFRISLASVNAN